MGNNRLVNQINQIEIPSIPIMLPLIVDINWKPEFRGSNKYN